MNDLAILKQTAQTMSSREISELTSKEHHHVLRDIRAYVGAVVQMERGIDVRSMDWSGKEGIELFGYTPIGGVTMAFETNPQNRQSYPIYHLDKNATLTIISGYNILLRKRIIDRWQELEAQNNAPALPNFNDPVAAARAWADAVEKQQVAIAQVAELQPKAQALEAISHSTGSLGIREAAKAVGMGQNDFVAWCTDKSKPVTSRFMYRDESSVLHAYSHRISAGMMTEKLNTFVGGDGRERSAPKVKFTPKGITHIAKMLKSKEVVA